MTAKKSDCSRALLRGSPTLDDDLIVKKGRLRNILLLLTLNIRCYILLNRIK